MMDVYIPVAGTLTPCAYTPANDEPWTSITGTESIVWFKAPSQVKHAGYSSTSKPMTFFVLDNPAHIGLERLRSFKGWKDNWDAEGASAPKAEVIDIAGKVFSLLALHRLPQVTLTSDGHPMFVFGGSHRGEVVVTGPDTLDYYFADEDAPSDFDVLFDGETLPADLTGYVGATAA